MQLSVSEEVLSLLVCPKTGQGLRLVPDADLSEWSADSPFEGALVTDDGSRAYPIRNGFPHLVESERLRSATTPDATGSSPSPDPV